MTTVTTCSPILEDLGVSSKKIELTTALYEKHKPRVRLALQVHVRERSSDLVVSRSLVRGVSSLVLRSLVSARLRRVASRWRGTAAHGRDIHEPRSRPPTQHRPRFAVRRPRFAACPQRSGTCSLGRAVVLSSRVAPRAFRA